MREGNMAADYVTGTASKGTTKQYFMNVMLDALMSILHEERMEKGFGSSQIWQWTVHLLNHNCLLKSK